MPFQAIGVSRYYSRIMSLISKDHNDYWPLCGIYDLVPFEACPCIRTARSFIFSVGIDGDGRRTFIYQHLSKFTQDALP